MWMLFEVIAALLIITTVLFIHEIGHAIPVLLRNKQARVEIYMGSRSEEKKLKLRFGRLTCYLNISFSGLCRIVNADELPPATNRQKILFGAGGPIASLIAFAALYFLSHSISGVMGIILNRAAIGSFFTFLFTALPITYPSFMRNLGGMRSDGLYVLDVLKEMKKQSKAVS